MERSWSRRALLQALGLTASIGFAGCTQFAVSRRPEPSSPSDFSRITSVAAAVEALSFTATTRNQASPTQPPQFHVELTNEGEQPVRLQWGQNIFYSAGSHDRASGLIIVPAEEHTPPAGTPTDGCWQYDQFPIFIKAIATRGTLPPGDSETALFTIYDDPETEGCYPAGEYIERDRLELLTPQESTDAEAGTIPLAVTITITPEKHVSVTGGIPA